MLISRFRSIVNFIDNEFECFRRGCVDISQWALENKRLIDIVLIFWRNVMFRQFRHFSWVRLVSYSQLSLVNSALFLRLNPVRSDFIGFLGINLVRNWLVWIIFLILLTQLHFNLIISRFRLFDLNIFVPKCFYLCAWTRWLLVSLLYESF